MTWIELTKNIAFYVALPLFPWLLYQFIFSSLLLSIAAGLLLAFLLPLLIGLIVSFLEQG